MTSTTKEWRPTAKLETRATLPTMHCVFSPSSASKKATAKKKVLSDDDDDDFVPLKTAAAKKPGPAASSASKKPEATAKKKVLSDDDDDDFDPLKTPAAKKPAAKKLNSGKKPRAAAEPSEYEVVNGLDGQPLHSDAYMNNAPRRGTSGMPGVSSFKAKDGTEFYFPNFRSDTQVMVQLKTLKEPKTPEGLVNCAYKLDDWYDQKFADTNNKYWLDKKNFCIDESGQKVRPIPIRVPSRPLCPTTLLHRFGS